MRLWTALLLIGCSPIPGVLVQPKPIQGDADAACSHLRELHCPEADPGPNGETCEEELRLTLKEGMLDPKTSCLVGVKSCDAIPGCYE